MRERLGAIRGAIPAPVEHRHIKLPDELPGYDDWRRFGRDPWVEIQYGVYTDGSSVLYWTVWDGDEGLLLWGEKAKCILAAHPARRGRG